MKEYSAAIITVFSNYNNVLTELYCSSLDSSYLMKAAEQLDGRYSSSDIWKIELKYFNEGEVRVFRVDESDVFGRGVSVIMTKIIELIKEDKFTILENAVKSEFQDLIGWNLVDAFTCGEPKNHYMTFEKDGVVKQFYLAEIIGSAYKFYNFRHKDKTFLRVTPNCENSWEGDMYSISQIIKGKVIEIKGNTVVTEHGEFGWCSFYYGDKSIMLECKEIIENPLKEPKEYEIISKSIEKADYEAYSKTRYYCIDVLSRTTPRDDYLKEHRFSLWFEIVDKRTKLSIASFFNSGEFKYKDLNFESNKIIDELKPFIEKMNREKNFEIVDNYTCESIDVLREALNTNKVYNE